MMRLFTHATYLLRYWRRHAFVFGKAATPRRITNFLRSEGEARQCSVKLASYPWEMFVDPVNSCPLQCPLCLTGQRCVPRTKMSMSIDSYKRYTTHLLPYLYRLRLFNYGEPFINNNVFEMIAFTEKSGVAVQVNSNLNVWEKGYAESCVKSGLTTLVVSFDGISQQAYTSYRIGGDVEKVKRNIEELAAVKKRLHSKKPAIVLQYLMQRHNEHEYDRIAAYAKKVGALFFPQPLTIDILDEEQRKKWLPLDEAKTHYDRVKLIKKKLHPEKSCGFLWNRPVINVDGGVSPCCHLFYDSTDFGNLNDGSFLEIWNNDKFTAARMVQREKRKTGADIVCSRCIDERAFVSAEFDLVNEYRSNLLK
jgi:radical SAM protein with 4Fe4S-binding SPASM domain